MTRPPDANLTIKIPYHMDVEPDAMCPACGSCSFRSATWVSDSHVVVPALECLECGVFIAEDDPSEPLSAGWVSDERPTWRPPAKRKSPMTSGTFESVPVARSPLRRKA
jgi:hypothetical protein